MFRGGDNFRDEVHQVGIEFLHCEAGQACPVVVLESRICPVADQNYKTCPLAIQKINPS